MIKKGKKEEEEAEKKDDKKKDEKKKYRDVKAIVGLGKSRARSTRDAAQRRVRGRRRSWRAAGASALKKWKTAARSSRDGVEDRERAPGRAADVHERRAATRSRGLAFYRIEPADMLIVVDEVQLPLGKLRLRRSRVGRRPQRAEVGDRARRRGVSAAAHRRRTRQPDGDLADHVLSTFRAGRARSVQRR